VTTDLSATATVLSPAVVLVVVIAVAVLGYGSAFTWVFPAWLDQGTHYSHGFLVIALVGFRLWQDWALLIARRLRGSSVLRRLLALFGASIVWLFSVLSGIQVPGAVATLAIIWLGAGLAVGQGGVWRLTPYSLLLFSVVPIWHPYANPFLQAIATSVVNAVLQSFNLTIYMEQNTIVMPDVVFEIVGGCSGFGYLLAALTLSAYLALAERLRLIPGLILIGAFAALALLSNWIRITAIMLVGYTQGPAHPLLNDHIWFGWVVFGVIFLPVLWYVPAHLARLPKREATMTRVEAAASEGIPRRILLWTIGTMTVIPAASLLLATSADINLREPVWLEPSVASRLHLSVKGNADSWDPQYPSASNTRMQVLSDAVRPGVEVMLYQAYYANQSDGHEVVDSGNDLAGPGWVRNSSATTRVEAAYQSGNVSSVHLESEDRSRHLLVWYWYQVGKMQAASDLEAKLAQVLQKLQFRADAKLVAVAASCEEADCEETAATLGKFLQTLKLKE